MENEQFVSEAVTSDWDIKRDWRFISAALSAILLLFSYFLPFFTHRITAATTTFSGGTVVENEFPVLIRGQHFAQTKRPLGEELVSVDLVVQDVPTTGQSGWAWLYTLAASDGGLGRFADFIITMLLPPVSALVALAFVWRSFSRQAGPAEALIPVSVNLAMLAIPALLLSWAHQFDFSSALLRLSQNALMPGIGLWFALLAAASMSVSLYSMRNMTRRDLITWWALVFAVVLLIWILVRFRPYPFLEIWAFISDGILVTLRIVATSFGFILLVSLLGGLGRISSNRVIYGISSLYVEIIRGIPLLVQLLFIWFALPQIFRSLGASLVELPAPVSNVGLWFSELRLNPFTAAVIGLTVCYGAYGAEIFRAGISSIHGGQMEAARSLGMSYVQAMRYVILPQAVRVILPPIGNEFVALLKDSSLVSVLAVSDLTRRGREYMARTFLSFDTWIMVALCYLVLTLFSSRVVEFIESQTRFEH